MDEATAKKIVSDRRVMAVIRKYCDERDLPYPPKLIEWLSE